MTTVIHIWDQPTPTSWAEAQVLAARLSDQPAAPNPKFIELARRMNAAFPEFGGEWTLDAPDGVVEEAVWALGVENPVRLYPRLVDTAVALGLSVYDEESEACFVPGPWCLSPQGVHPVVWPTPAPAQAVLDPEPRVRALVDPALAARGFHLQVERKSEFMLLTNWWRDTPLGKQWIRIDWKRLTETVFEVHLWAQIEPTLPPELLPLCDPQRIIRLQIFDAPLLRPFAGIQPSARSFSNPIGISNAGPLDELLATVSAWLEADMLPVMDQCRTVLDFLAYDLGEPRLPIAIRPYQSNLVLAFWAGSPDLDRRFELLVQRVKHHNDTAFFLNQTHRALLAKRES